MGVFHTTLFFKTPVSKCGVWVHFPLCASFTGWQEKMDYLIFLLILTYFYNSLALIFDSQRFCYTLLKVMIQIFFSLGEGGGTFFSYYLVIKVWFYCFRYSGQDFISAFLNQQEEVSCKESTFLIPEVVAKFGYDGMLGADIVCTTIITWNGTAACLWSFKWV